MGEEAGAGVREVTVITCVPKSLFGRKGTPFARLDPEFVHPDYLALEAGLRKLGAKAIGTIRSEIGTIDGLTGMVRYVAIDEIDTDDGLLVCDELLAGDLPSRARWKLKLGDVLVSNVRPNRGAVGFVTKRNATAIGSSGLTPIRVSASEDFPPEYVFAFFRTAAARMQLLRRNRGSMYPAVLTSDVHEVLIPAAPATLVERVRDEVQRAASEWETFFDEHKKATDSLRKFLAAVPAPPSPSESPHGVSVTEIRRSASLAAGSAERIDAEFFRAEYDKYDKALRKQFNTFVLGQRYDLFTGSNIRFADDAQDVPIVKQAVLTNVGINWSAIQTGTGQLPDEGDIGADDILLACTAHEVFYVGRKVDYVRSVPEACERNVAVADVMIIRPKSESKLPGSYVAAFLRSNWGRHQVQRCIRGLRSGHVYARDLGQHVRVPIPSDPWLRSFEGLSAAAENARNEGKKHVTNAVDALEQWLKSTLPGYE